MIQFVQFNLILYPKFCFVMQCIGSLFSRVRKNRRKHFTNCQQTGALVRPLTETSCSRPCPDLCSEWHILITIENMTNDELSAQKTSPVDVKVQGPCDTH